MPTDLRLRVDGNDYAGWKSVRVVRGIESVAGSFDLEVSDRWAEQREPWPIGAESACVVLLGTTPVILGYIDRRALAYSEGDHRLTVAGRDKTGALVDCSATPGQWEYLNTSLLTFAQRIAEPLGITVALQEGLTLKRLPKITVDPGDSAFNAIERGCRIAGVLPVSDGQGGLLLTRAGSSRTTTALVEGENIIHASADYDATGRFARYVVMGQHQGSEDLYGGQAAFVRGEARDAGVRRTSRTLVVRPEGAVLPETATRRAQWEAKVRAARGASVSITVLGWTQGDGSLWPINALVRVKSPMLGLDGDLLITQATYTLDATRGARTELALKRPDAFLPEPVVVDETKRIAELAGGA